MAKPCRHRNLERLGMDDGYMVYKCKDCGNIVKVQIGDTDEHRQFYPATW